MHGGDDAAAAAAVKMANLGVCCRVCVVVCVSTGLFSPLGTFQAAKRPLIPRAHANFYALSLHNRTSYPPIGFSVALIAF